MASSAISASCSSNQCSIPSVVTSPISRSCLGKINGLVFFGGRNNGYRKFGDLSIPRSYVRRKTKHSSLTTEQKKPSSRDRRGRWEKPDDGSTSDTDDKDNVEENDLSMESDWEGETVVEMAANYEEELRKEVENMLEPEERAILERNALPNMAKTSTAKWSALHTLGLSGQIPFMDELLVSGMHIDIVDKDGLTALHMAVIGKKEAVISHLLRKGASPHVKDKDGWTPLHISMQTRNRDIVKVLLVNGADKTRKNKDGKTPLDLSLCYGKDFKAYDLAKLLKLVPANGDY